MNDKEISKTNVDSTLTCGVFTKGALILFVVLLQVSNIGTPLEISQGLKSTKMKLIQPIIDNAKAHKNTLKAN